MEWRNKLFSQMRGEITGQVIRPSGLNQIINAFPKDWKDLRREYLLVVG
jgi:hypothetical protein